MTPYDAYVQRMTQEQIAHNKGVAMIGLVVLIVVVVLVMAMCGLT